MRLDVRIWHRRRMLASGYSGTWSWTNSQTGERTGSIGFRAEQSTVVLSYTLDGEPREQRVPILHTPCNYGGTRPWFACPHCAARVAVIYLRRGGFYCRKCAHVSYYSQSEDACDRIWRTQRKAEAKLGEGWRRPKGMHQATYRRLKDIIFQCEDRRDQEIEHFLARLGARF